MKIGQDISLQVCRDEGYGVIEFKVKDLYPQGNGRRKGPLNKEQDVHYTSSYPLHVREELGFKVGESIMITSALLNWNDLWKIYLENKKGIDSMIGGSYEYDNPAAALD